MSKVERISISAPVLITKSIPNEELGYWVGELVVNNLPTLCIDYIQTNNVYPISLEDAIEEKTLYDKYDKLVDVDKKVEAWTNRLTHGKLLQKQYLPNVVEIYTPNVCISNVTNIDEFKKGFITSLWDSDCCSYSLNYDDVLIKDSDDGMFMLIILKLKNNV